MVPFAIFPSTRTEETHLGCRVVLYACCQMAKDRVHSVPWLLPSDAQERLQSPGHRRKDRLRRFVRIHGNGRSGVFPLAQSTDVREGVFGGENEARLSFPNSTLVLQLLVESIVVSTSVRSVR